MEEEVMAAIHHPHHKSGWKNCTICSGEFLALTATICPECQKQQQYKKRNKKND
jgi:hypothetical protein